MELDLKKALLLSFLSILALSFPCRAATWTPERNLSTAASLPCDPGAAGCRIADLQPDLEAVGDPGMLGASLATVPPTQSAQVPTKAGCGRKLPNGKYTPCTTDRNPLPRCDVHCRTGCPC